MLKKVYKKIKWIHIIILQLIEELEGFLSNSEDEGFTEDDVQRLKQVGTVFDIILLSVLYYHNYNSLNIKKVI